MVSEADEALIDELLTRLDEQSPADPITGQRCLLGTDYDRLVALARSASAAKARLDLQLTELQQLYAAFKGSCHSPKNPREAAQAIGQMRDAELEFARLTEKYDQEKTAWCELAGTRIKEIADLRSQLAEARGKAAT
jgi:hypothetical protein